MFFIAEVQIKSTESAWGIHTASLISSPISEVFAKVLKHFVMNVRMVPEGGGREREGERENENWSRKLYQKVTRESQSWYYLAHMCVK